MLDGSEGGRKELETEKALATKFLKTYNREKMGAWPGLFLKAETITRSVFLRITIT